jgi:hypothetical protein
MKPKVFIGSSIENLEIAYSLQENLEHDAEVTVWSQGIFELSNYNLDALIDSLDEYDFGVFIFAPDDITKIRGVDHQTVRDNVVFELGLFTGRLGKERSFIIIPRGFENFHLPTDLLGLTPATYEPNRQDGNLNAALGPASNKIRKTLNKFGFIDRPGEPVLNTEPSVAEYDENDYISILQSWMGSRPSNLNTQVIKYSELDRKLGFPKGTTEKCIIAAARRWDYVVERKGKQTILFREARK